MTKILIVYCHPYAKSFNHAILEAVEHNFDHHQVSYTVIDLYQDQFVPSYDVAELRLFHAGKTHDPLVQKYLRLLQRADGLVIISPVLWNDVPAMLKGFIDKVMKEGPGLSHIVTKTGVKGLLTNLQHAYVLTTSTSPTFYLRLFCGNALNGVFVHHTLKQIGVQHAYWYNFGGITKSTLKKRQRYLQQVAEKSFRF